MAKTETKKSGTGWLNVAVDYGPLIVFLAVYRNREDEVKFLELNAATARLLELVRDNESAGCGELLNTLAAEMSLDVSAIEDFGLSQLADFHRLGIIALAP